MLPETVRHNKKTYTNPNSIMAFCGSDASKTEFNYVPRDSGIRSNNSLIQILIGLQTNRQTQFALSWYNNGKHSGKTHIFGEGWA
jgi:hypothetical protein